MPRIDETPLALTRRARAMERTLAELYPDAHCELDFRNPFELLVATLLSAQSTDKGVNRVTPQLFARYPDPESLAAANLVELETIIRPTGFFHTKATNLIRLSTALVENYGGEVPPRLRDLVTLPGVGRKTANVVLGNAFGIPGITPDTHFIRLTNRFGWVDSTEPDRVEAEVGALFPRRVWVQLCHEVIWHGRRRCHARKPACGACPLAARCPSFGIGEIDPEAAAKLVKA